MIILTNEPYKSAIIKHLQDTIRFGASSMNGKLSAFNCEILDFDASDDDIRFIVNHKIAFDDGLVAVEDRENQPPLYVKAVFMMQYEYAYKAPIIEIDETNQVVAFAQPEIMRNSSLNSGGLVEILRIDKTVDDVEHIDDTIINEKVKEYLSDDDVNFTFAPIFSQLSVIKFDK